jgi:hypothetical protein
MDSIWLWILAGALLGIAYALIQFLQSVRRFNKSRRQLDNLLKRIGTP